MFVDACLDAFWDSLNTLPFLFLAFLAMEALEHHCGHMTNRFLSRVGKAGPGAGALLGLVPQCGFSAAAANLYAGGLISLGTLLAVFLATSDEAVLIFLGHPHRAGLIGSLLAVKFFVGMAAGYGIDLLYRGKESRKHISDLCKTCGCHETKGILRPALIHTGRIFVWLFLISLALNLLLAAVGTGNLAALLGRGSRFQPFITGLIGLIPNCGASVLLAELYLAGGISFGAAIAGLCSGAGLGLAVLFRMDGSKGECLKILLLLYGLAVLAGIILQEVLPFLMGF